MNGYEKLMCNYAKEYGIIIHNYCLMSNHYHILLEIKQTNLSKYMKQLNMSYSIYFNKKYKRVGHLWQGRFKSWYVTNEAYLYTLMCYIEQNPLKAKIVKKLEYYKYSSYNHFVSKDTPKCLKSSWIIQSYKNNIADIKAILNSKIDTEQLKELKKASSLVEAPNIDNKPDIKKLTKILSNYKDKKERNKLIVQSYKQGYSQHTIAKIVGISQQAVGEIIKRYKV